MRLLHRLILAAGLSAALISSITGVRAGTATAAETWLDNYYQKPAPEKFVPAMLELSRSGYLDEAGHVPLAIGFIAAVFQQNSSRVSEWMALREELPPAHQRLLIAGLWYSGLPQGRDYLRADARRCEPAIREEITALLGSRPSLREASVLSESSLNLQWGVFLATGDAAPVRNILAALGANGSSRLGQDVRWSLAQNAARHDRVLAICRDELNRQPNAIRETLRAVINDTESRRAPST